MLNKLLSSLHSQGIEMRKLTAVITTIVIMILSLFLLVVLPTFPGSQLVTFFLGLFLSVASVFLGLLLPEESILDPWLEPPERKPPPKA